MSVREDTLSQALSWADHGCAVCNMRFPLVEDFMQHKLAQHKPGERYAYAPL